jgi:hypothetical protein
VAHVEVEVEVLLGHLVHQINQDPVVKVVVAQAVVALVMVPLETVSQPLDQILVQVGVGVMLILLVAAADHLA